MLYMLTNETLDALVKTLAVFSVATITTVAFQLLMHIDQVIEIYKKYNS